MTTYDEPDWLADEHIRSLDAMVASTPSTNGDRTPNEHGAGDGIRRQVLDIAALRRLRPPTPLVHGLLDLDSVALLYGPPGAGKSFVALDLGLRIATGTRWHGHQPVEHGEVLYIAAEGAHGVAARIDAWKAMTGTIIDPSRFTVLPVAVNLLDARHVAAIVDYVGDLAPVMVVIDTLARCAIGVEENSSRDMSIVVAALDQIRVASGGACVLAVHHSGKNLDAGARGHTALLGAADTVLRVTSTERILQLDQEKQKHHDLGHRQTYRLVTIANSVALEPYARSANDDITTKALTTLEALAGIEEPDGVSYSRWKAQATDAGVSDSSFDRHRKTLLDLSLVTPIGPADSKTKRYGITDTGRAHLPPADDDAQQMF